MEQKPHIEITCMEVTPLREEKLFADWLEKMPAFRRQKITSLRNAESQRLSLGVGVLLFLALERKGMDGHGVRIAEERFGKPYLPDYPGFYFSLSHAGSWAMCAAGDLPVGCDTERTGREDSRVVKRFFHTEEREYLERETDPELRDRLFTRIWTRKEAYLKMTGAGLNVPMDSFSALASPPGVRYSEAEMAEGYAFSCCVRGEKEPVFNWRTVSAGAGSGLPESF